MAKYYLTACIIETTKYNIHSFRLKGHLTANREQLMWLLNDHLSSCRPLFQIFEANRSLFCRHTISPLNGLWFAGLMCILLWLVATPLSLALATIYRRLGCARQLSHTNSHQYKAFQFQFCIFLQLTYFQSSIGLAYHIRAKPLGYLKVFYYLYIIMLKSNIYV